MSQLRSKSGGEELRRSAEISLHMCRLKYNDVKLILLLNLGIELDREGPQSRTCSHRCHCVSLDASRR